MSNDRRLADDRADGVDDKAQLASCSVARELDRRLRDMPPKHVVRDESFETHGRGLHCGRLTSGRGDCGRTCLSTLRDCARARDDLIDGRHQFIARKRHGHVDVG